ncbi:MAG: putative ATPase [Chthonomonadaceae bacterium]|nr:putative ATPase [Chthonomonadaceae bacterium]
MTSLSVGTVTFLFTDIVGSTRLWDTEPEAMKQAHARHAELIAESVTAHQGHLVRIRGEGDSTFSVFRSAPDALAAACAFQCALTAEAWPTRTPLRVRAALHCGTAELREGDYNSTAVNRCARLRGIAAPGQTLVSQVVVEMTRDNLPEGGTLLSLGAHRLKDLQRPEQVYQLCHPDLPSEFPPLHSLDSLPTNLPQQLNSFIGREKEIAYLVFLLSPHQASASSVAGRLLTVAGAGGAGKTRLTVQAGAELLDLYPDGVWLVELAALTEGSMVVQAITTVLGLREEPGRTLLATLQEHLRDREMLLILDNCEHLVDACARVAQTLLHACPNVRLLATSRETLNIPGETVWRIPSLSLPEEGADLSAASVSASEAAQLFVERAQAVVPSFHVTAQNAGAVAQISRRLDGIPLALELAAARVRSLSAEQIAERLDDRFRLLTGGSRTALPRQQTLRGLIDWSYQLLNEREKTLLRRLSVFSGGWTLDAAESVCADDPEDPDAKIEAWEVLDLLDSLVEKSLALSEEANQQRRYRLLETIRQYSRERLDESAEASAVRCRHRDVLLRFVEETAEQLGGPDQVEMLNRLEREHDNIRAAQDTCTREANGGRIALRIAGALWRFWHIRGHYAEGRRRFETALASPEAQEPSAERMRALNGAGNIAWGQGDVATARLWYGASLDLARQLEDLKGVAAALGGLSLAAKRAGDLETARGFQEESLAIAREIGDARSIGTSLLNLGNIYGTLGDHAKARQMQEESLQMRRQLGDKQGMASVLSNLGFCNLLMKDYAAARSTLLEGLRLCRELDNRRGTPFALEYLAMLAVEEDRPEPAITLYGAAYGLRERSEMSLSATEAQSMQETYEVAKAKVGPENYEALFAYGRILTLEQAVDFALKIYPDA